nr:structural maintenance of chromosomes protein 5 isoform X1 [Hydra vulgaris]
MSKKDTVDGRIVRLKLKNFLTYDDCEFFPGENLNVVLGPNGTGKSSIVCAICLGLGGSPLLLGRAKDVGDYVKHRTKQAVIEIELFKSHGPNLVVKRIINKGSKNDSECESSSHSWYLNGKSTSKSAVVSAAADLNVQMNNLCQFLPQDKVNEFAKMTPQQLLEATEKAVGEPGMHEKHMELINLSSEFRKIQANLSEKETAKARVEQRNKQLERDVLRHKEREKHQEQINMLQKKKPWVEYESARLSFFDIKKDKKDIEVNLKECREKNAPIEKELMRHRNSLDQLEKKDKELRDNCANISKIANQTKDKMEKESEKVEDFNNEISNIKKEHEKRKERIQKFNREIGLLQKDLKDSPNPDILKPESDRISEVIKNLTKQFNSLTRDASEFLNEKSQHKGNIENATEQLKKLESADNLKLESLRRFDRGCYDAVLWLRSNQDKFSGKIYEPVMTQINMKNMKDAVYLESTISFNDFKSFVCENRKDQALFSDLMKDVLHLDIPSVCPPHDSMDSFTPKIPLQDLKKFGFENYMTDLFDCPKTVLKYLCENYKLHNIPIGTKITEERCNQVLAEMKGISLFFTPDSSYRMSVSKYSGKTSSNVSSLNRNRNYLNKSVDIDEKKRLEGLLQMHQKEYDLCSEKYNQIKKEIEVVNKKLEETRQQKQEIVSQMKKRSTLMSQIESKQNRLQEEEKGCPNIQNQIDKMKVKINHTNKTRLELSQQYVDQISKCIKITKERLLLAMTITQEKILMEQVQAQFRTLSENLKSLEEAYHMVSERCNNMKKQAKILLKRAQQITGETMEHLKEAFNNLPNTLEEIEALIHEQQAKLDCQYETNPLVVLDYEKNKKEINTLDTEIKKTSELLADMLLKKDSLLQSWLVPLEQLILRINEQYSLFFKQMGCVGQVSLEKDPDEDYRKYGVQIQVKFRAENKLKTLTSTFQSGGERSVSTMLYLISLQELTKCPFRLVDEINQGMDPNNERRVFELVVETVCRPNTSQYFLITPKLLPNLRYTERMTILLVMNGHWMLRHDEYDVKEMIKRKRNQKSIQ